MKSPSDFKSTGGVKRLFSALQYSASGLAAAFKHEAAFRQELLLCIILIPLAYFVGENLLERALLWSSLLILLVVELLNSAIEALADAISLEYHPLIKRAKDIASAAVLLTLFAIAGLWMAVWWSHF